MKKVIFVFAFVPLHSFATFYALQPAMASGLPGGAFVGKCLFFLFTFPLVLPLIVYDPDGDRLPRWLQYASLPANSLLWGVALVLAHGWVRSWRRPA